MDAACGSVIVRECDSEGVEWGGWEGWRREGRVLQVECVQFVRNGDEEGEVGGWVKRKEIWCILTFL